MAVLLSDSVTVLPPVGAAAERVTVHVEVAPDATVAGAHASEDTIGRAACTVTEAVLELPFKAAVTVTVWLAVTVPALALKLPAVAPAATVTDVGTVSAVLLSDSVTALPPVGAAAERVTVHVELPPEAIVPGVHPNDVTIVVADGVTVTKVVFELPFSDAAKVTAWFAVTVPAVAVKLAVVAPPATVPDVGTVSAVLLPEMDTVVPPVGAACEIVTVQVDLLPETIVAGVHTNDVTVAVVVGVTVMEAVFELPFSDAVTVAAWLAVTVPALAVKQLSSPPPPSPMAAL